MKEEPQFIDAEEYMGEQEKVTFKEIVFRHLSKISEISTKEFRKGYWQKKPVSVSGGVYMSETYIEDKRDSYINAVDFLYDLLLPHFDEDMNEATEEIEKLLGNTLKKFTEEKKTKTDWIDEKLSIKRKLFQKLNLLLERLNYLSARKFKD